MCAFIGRVTAPLLFLIWGFNEVKREWDSTIRLKQHILPISCWCDSCCMCLSLLLSAALQDRADVHHIANTLICRVLLQSRKQGKYLLIIATSTTARGDNSTFGAITSASADTAAPLVPSRFPSASWRRRHSASTGQAEFIHLLCSLCPVKYRLQIRY